MRVNHRYKITSKTSSATLLTWWKARVVTSLLILGFVGLSAITSLIITEQVSAAYSNSSLQYSNAEMIMSSGGWGHKASAASKVEQDGRMMFGMYNSNDGLIRLMGDNNQSQVIVGEPMSHPLVGDWDGDGKPSFGYFRDGVFMLDNDMEMVGNDETLQSGRPYDLGRLNRSRQSGQSIQSIQFGLPDDLPVVGDWDGDGMTTIGVYRNGVFYLRNSNTPGEADLVIAYGEAGDVPMAGHFNGLGFDTVGVYRARTGRFYLLQDHNDLSTVVSVQYGAEHPTTTSKLDARPVVGDWDGDGITTVGIYQTGQFHLSNSLASGGFDQTVILGMGINGDTPIAIRPHDTRFHPTVR